MRSSLRVLLVAFVLAVAGASGVAAIARTGSESASPQSESSPAERALSARSGDIGATTTSSVPPPPGGPPPPLGASPNPHPGWLPFGLTAEGGFM